jgi:hypothetical protein
MVTSQLRNKWGLITQPTLSSDHVFELNEWVRHLIDEAEKNGDVCKRKRFLALRADLQ